jgi:hypothetical protein
MKVTYDIREIDKETALEMIQKYHYSRTLPKLNKHFIGFYVGGGYFAGLLLLGGVLDRYTQSKSYFQVLKVKIITKSGVCA